MTESRRRGNAGRQAWAIWMLAVGVWIGMSIPAQAAIPSTVSLSYRPGSAPASSAETSNQQPGKAWAHVSLSYDQAPGPQLVPIIATIDPSDATGFIVFRLNGAQVGPAVPLADGRAESIPVDVPEPETSYSIGFEYSGDDSYRAIASQLISDWRPETPEELPVAAAPSAPAPLTPSPVPAPAEEKTLPRTGSDPVPMALLAVALIGFGCLLERAGRDEMLQSP